MARTKGVNKKLIAQILRDSVFSPTEPGPLKVIAEVGDPRYYKQRAIEMIHTSVDTPFAGDEIQMAISLLALAMAESQLRNNRELLKYAKPADGKPYPDGKKPEFIPYPVTCGGQGLEFLDNPE